MGACYTNGDVLIAPRQTGDVRRDSETHLRGTRSSSDARDSKGILDR